MAKKRLTQAEITNLLDSQKLPLTLSGTDADGNAADFTGVTTTFTVTPDAAGQVQPDPADTTGKQFIFVPNTAAGNLGNANIAASAAVPGGAAPLTGSVDVNVAAGAPINIALTPGTPA